MSTRSFIGYQTKTGKLKVVYCHSDGYPSWNGKMLLKNYNSLDKIKAIVELGDLSWLGASIEVPVDCITGDLSFIHKDDINKPHNQQRKYYDTHSYFYGRDRGEKGSKARTFDDINKAAEYHSWCEYAYIFIDGKLKAYNLTKTGNPEFNLYAALGISGGNVSAEGEVSI